MIQYNFEYSVGMTTHEVTFDAPGELKNCQLAACIVDYLANRGELGKAEDVSVYHADHWPIFGAASAGMLLSLVSCIPFEEGGEKR